MRKYSTILLTLVFFATIPAYAQNATAPDNDTVLVRKSDLPPDVLKQLESKKELDIMQQKIETYGKWVGLGKEVGTAVNESLGALTSQAENFSKTGVGQFTMFMVAWKVLGREFIGFIIGVPLLILGTGVFLWSYRRTCMPYSVLVKVNADKSKEYKVLNEEDLQSDPRKFHFIGMRWAHIVSFVVFTLIVFFWII